MSKILMLSSEYGISANGICVRNVVEEIVKRGHSVWIISEGEQEKVEKTGNVEIHYIRMPLFSLALKKHTMTGIKKLLVSSWRIVRALYASLLYPNSSPIFSARVYKKAIEIIEQNKIDEVICSYLPYSSIYTGLRLKKTYGDKLEVIGYHLDLLSASNNSSALVRKYKRIKTDPIWKKELNILDKIIVPEAFKIDYASSKMVKCGFPVYTINHDIVEYDFKFDTDSINISFVGSLSMNRDPAKVIKIFEKLNNKFGCNIILHIWGSVEQSIKDEMIKHNCVKYHGYISNSYTWYLFSNSQYLLNISNTIQNDLIPSKIFQYFSTEKPIINVVKNANDPSLDYFHKYRRYIEIYEDYDIEREDILPELYKLLMKEDWGKIDYDRSYFQNYSPEHCADVILS